jgi:hypothetical protein
MAMIRRSRTDVKFQSNLSDPGGAGLDGSGRDSPALAIPWTDNLRIGSKFFESSGRRGFIASSFDVGRSPSLTNSRKILSRVVPSLGEAHHAITVGLADARHHPTNCQKSSEPNNKYENYTDRDLSKGAGTPFMKRFRVNKPCRVPYIIRNRWRADIDRPAGFVNMEGLRSRMTW